MEIMHCYCWASGLIEFATHVPKGAIRLFGKVGPKLRKKISARARHSRENDDMFVPGVPEGRDENEKLQEVASFVKWVKTDKVDSQAIARSRSRLMALVK